MTEADWLAATDPVPMLAYLDVLELGRPRRARLLRVAAARSVWAELADGRLRAAVEVGEHYADGRSDDAELERHRNAMYGLYTMSGDRGWLAGLDFKAPSFALACVNGPKLMAHFWCGGSWTSLARHLGPRLPPLIRDLFGNPFRPAPVADPRWLSAVAVALAHTVYNTRDSGRMPELAAALEAEGCDSADLLAHCRSGGPHARGCWALDLILGRH